MKRNATFFMLCLVAMSHARLLAAPPQPHDDISEIDLHRGYNPGRGSAEMLVLRPDGAAIRFTSLITGKREEFRGTFARDHFVRLIRLLESQRFFDADPVISEVPIGRLSIGVRRGGKLLRLNYALHRDFWVVVMAIRGVAYDIKWQRTKVVMPPPLKAGQGMGPGRPGRWAGNPPSVILRAGGMDKYTYAVGETVKFKFAARNVGKVPYTLTFRSGQEFDISATPVMTEPEDAYIPIWEWDHGKSFTQASRKLTLAPGEAYSWEATWDQTDYEGHLAPRGTYEIRTVVMADAGNNTGLVAGFRIDLVDSPPVADSTAPGNVSPGISGAATANPS